MEKLSFCLSLSLVCVVDDLLEETHQVLRLAGVHTVRTRLRLGDFFLPEKDRRFRGELRPVRLRVFFLRFAVRGDCGM